MQSYLKGTIQKLTPSQLIIENRGIGYQFIIFHYNLFPKEGIITVYQSSIVNEYEEETYGFPNHLLRDYFNDLIAIKTVGPKTAALILTKFTPESWNLLIQNQDLDQLLTIKGIGLLTAKLILKTLNVKYFGLKLNNNQNAVLNAFVKIGYSQKTIYPLIQKLDTNLDLETLTFETWKQLQQNEI